MSKLERILPLVALLLFAACASEPAQERSRVLLVGMDGLEWSVLGPMVQRGELPAFRSLMERGTYGRLETLEPTLSPVIWTTIATGKPPEEHGIRAFVYGDPETGESRLYSRLDRKSRAFWNILTDEERRVHVVGWFLTYPAEPINGMMVSQFTTLDRVAEYWKGSLQQGVPGQTYPESLIQELAPEIEAAAGDVDSLRRRIFGETPPSADGLERRLIEHTSWALEADTLYGRIAEKILHSDPEFDLLAVYFGGPDVVGHRFWRYYRPGEFLHPPSEAEADRFGEIIPRYYRYVDERLGRLLSACDDDTVVMLVSDHGMRAINRSLDFSTVEKVQQMNSGHHPGAAPGVLIAAGPGIRGTEVDLDELGPADVPSLGSVLQITPTLLYLQRLPIAQDMRHGLMRSLLDPGLLEDQPPVFVNSYEGSGSVEEAEEADPEFDTEMMERFRALGYIGG